MYTHFCSKLLAMNAQLLPDASDTKWFSCLKRFTTSTQANTVHIANSHLCFINWNEPSIHPSIQDLNDKKLQPIRNSSSPRTKQFCQLLQNLKSQQLKALMYQVIMLVRYLDGRKIKKL